MIFREIDKSNYWDCMMLIIDDSQEGFVSDNKQSLVEAAYEDGLYTLGIYYEDIMVGFVLYDYDEAFSWMVYESFHDRKAISRERLWQTGCSSIF